MKHTKSMARLALALITAPCIHAHPQKDGWLKFRHGPLISDDPNYFVFADKVGNNRLDDELHIEFYVSLGYPVSTPDSECLLVPARIIPIYNGIYDFYLFNNRYESAPIVSRRQNPGIVMEWDFDLRSRPSDTNTFRFGYFHESNGQTLNNDQGTGAADFAALKAKVDEEYALSQVSRGWDYLMTRVQFISSTNTVNYRCYAELRHHFGFQAFGTDDSEEDVFWKAVDEQPRIRDYDGLRLLAERNFKLGVVDASLRIELKTGLFGEHALENWSCKPSFTYGAFHVFYFNGYGKEPSTYNERAQYVGLGFEFR